MSHPVHYISHIATVQIFVAYHNVTIALCTLQIRAYSLGLWNNDKGCAFCKTRRLYPMTSWRLYWSVLKAEFQRKGSSDKLSSQAAKKKQIVLVVRKQDVYRLLRDLEVDSQVLSFYDNCHRRNTAWSRQWKWWKDFKLCFENYETFCFN